MVKPAMTREMLLASPAERQPPKRDVPRQSRTPAIRKPFISRAAPSALCTGKI